jgi:hypothetical protein
MGTPLLLMIDAAVRVLRVRASGRCPLAWYVDRLVSARSSNSNAKSADLDNREATWRLAVRFTQMRCDSR